MPATHTPGPWHLGLKPGPMIYGSDTSQVADLRGDLLDKSEALANARLIAAAPELLAALKLAVESLHKAFDYVPAGHENTACRGNLVPTLQNARAAIAKAIA